MRENNVNKNDVRFHLRNFKTIYFSGIGNSFLNDSIRLDPESLENATGSLYVAVACAIAMITLVVVTTSAVCIKNKKVRSQEAQ